MNRLPLNCFGLIALAFFATLAMSCGSQPDAAREYPVYRFETPPIIDGNIDDDPAWATVPRERAFVTPVIEEFDANFPAYKQTSFKVGYSSTSVFIAIESLEPWMRYLAEPPEAGQPFEKDDGIALYLSQPNQPDIHHFVVNATLVALAEGAAAAAAAGRWSGVLGEGASSLDDWNAAVGVEDKRYTVELEIPFAKLGFVPQPGSVVMGNIVRNTVSINSPEDRETSWSPVSSSFDDPSEFGRFVLEGDQLTPEEAREVEAQLATHADDIMQLESEVLSRIADREAALADVYRAQVRETGVGFTGVTRGPADLISPPDMPAGEVWRYGLGFPMQVSPTEAVLLTNIRMIGTGNIDFEIGTDAVLFDDLDEITTDNATPISRYERINDPALGNLIVRKGPVIAGFVPLGALLADGTPHPHAGTGFGIGWAASHRVGPGGEYDYLDFVERYANMYQFAYDGETFRVVDESRIDAATILPGWNLVGNFVTNGIPDGEDMLYVMIARVDDVSVAGYTRWRRETGVWKPVAFTPVTGFDVTWSEPSLVRDADGNLLLSARPYDLADPVLTFDIGVWRSTDNGDTWSRVIDQKNRRARSPVSVNRAADGTAFVAANTPAMRRTREVLSIWPLSSDGSELQGRITARDAKAEFGPAPSGSWWRIDHPNSAILRLADEQLHGVISYRIVDNGEVEGDAPPAPQTGCYVEEVFSAGEPAAVWRF